MSDSDKFSGDRESRVGGIGAASRWAGEGGGREEGR